MADISTLRSEEELDLVRDVFGENFFDIQVYDDLRDAQKTVALRGAVLSLLRLFDSYCNEHEIGYFAYGKTLRGAVAYDDFLPGDADIEIGMLRSEYNKLFKLLKRQTEESITLLGFSLEPGFDSKKYANIPALYPRIVAAQKTPLMFDGEPVYGRNSMPMQVRGSFELAIFDEVPDDFFTRKKFFRQMKRRNTIMKRAMNARELREDESGQRRFLHGAQLRYRLVPLRVASWGMHHRAKKYEGRGMENVTRMTGWRSAMVARDDIEPLQRMKFAGVEIWGPHRTEAWATEPIIETTPELKRLQDDAKQIVVEIDRVCQKLGIQYFCCGGTMLGHVRHGGFIPWDDDIDIGMMRADYERFLAEANEVMDTEHFFLQTRASDPNIPYLFSKVRMNDSEYITDYNKFRDFHKGICVDVFPFDYIPNDFDEQAEFRKEVREVEKVHNRIVNRQYPKAQSDTPTDRKGLDWLISQINGRLLARHYWSKSLDDTQAAYDSIVQRYDGVAEEEGLEYVASFVTTYTMARVDDLFPTQRVNFDGIDVMIPKEPEKFLTMQYGNFMVPPYPHQRAGHNLLLWADAQGVGGGREAEELIAEHTGE